MKTWFCSKKDMLKRRLDFLDTSQYSQEEINKSSRLEPSLVGFGPNLGIDEPYMPLAVMNSFKTVYEAAVGSENLDTTETWHQSIVWPKLDKADSWIPILDVDWPKTGISGPYIPIEVID